MKNLIIVFFALVSFSLSAQIKESQIENWEKVGKFQNYVELSKSGNWYKIQYQDMKFSQLEEYKSFQFENVGGAVDMLYSKMMEGINADKSEPVKLELPNDVITLEFGSSFGQSFVEIYHNPKGTDVIGKSMWLNEKRINKLFNR